MALFKTKEKLRYYSLEPILEIEAQYYVIFGERSLGKTYAALNRAIEKYVETGEQFAYIRRTNEQIRGKAGLEVMDNLIKNGVISKLTKGKWNNIHYESGVYYFSKYDEKKMKNTISKDPIGYSFAINISDNYKSLSFPGVKTIIFDEFLARGSYITGEFVLFTNLISTIVRQRDDVKIFLLGNTVNMYCPYFREMGLTNVLKMKPGDIDEYTYTNGEVVGKIAVEYTGGGNYIQGKPSDVYFAFNNPKLRMITAGGWELGMFPHLPLDMTILPKEERAKFFIDFENEIYKATLVKKSNSSFIYIEPLPKYEQVDENKDIIFSLNVDPRYNWRVNIYKPFDQFGQLILKYFNFDMVYYKDNYVGNAVENYLNECIKPMTHK